MDPATPLNGSGATAPLDKQRHFIRAMSKSIEGRPLEPSERTLLEMIFAALMRGDDVSDLTGIRRPRTQRSSDPVHVALHYLCLTRLMDMRAELAWDMVGDAWGLNRREVQRLIVEHRQPALAALPRFAGAPGRLLRICERHARGARPACDRSAVPASTDGSDDALVRMLFELVQPATASEGAAT
jgi:hypothetical protein